MYARVGIVGLNIGRCISSTLNPPLHGTMLLGIGNNAFMSLSYMLPSLAVPTPSHRKEGLVTLALQSCNNGM